MTHHRIDNAYAPTHFSELRAVDFADSRAGEHARTFLAGWQGKLVCDDYGGYKTGFQRGITDAHSGQVSSKRL